ncbi:NYN domain-containing protein [Candidatus Parcubacteria bacterium]|nr:NYN domain-containing protein [Candidatus Parcubacteria bacterium]
MAKNKKACVYIDGFNLFYGILKGSKSKWLDLEKLCKFYYPKYDIARISYFTALVKERKDNKESPVNQQIYLRALQTLPSFRKTLGSFQENIVRRPLVSKNKKGIRQKVLISFFDLFDKMMPLANGDNYPKPQYALIKKTEEKGSDVNLGISLVSDAYKNQFDIAVVISNDSDLSGALRIVKNELGKTVEILNPYPTTNKKLQRASSNIKYIYKKVLPKLQFPNELTDKVGKFHKPKSW